MASNHLQARILQALWSFVLDLGRFLLFLTLLSLALVGGLRVAFVLYGAVITSGHASSIGAFAIGGRAAMQILASFSNPESQFYTISLLGALFAGAAGHWVYQQLLADLGRLCRGM